MTADSEVDALRRQDRANERLNRRDGWHRDADKLPTTVTKTSKRGLVDWLLDRPRDPVIQAQIEEAKRKARELRESKKK